MPIGLFDLFTVGVAVLGYLIGRSRGLVWQLSGVATLVVGGLCATVLSRPLGSLFAEGLLGRFVAWVVVYAAVAVCLYVLSLKLKHRIDELEYDELDKRFGGMLGAFKGLLAFAVVTLIAVSISSNIERVVKRSASGQSLRYLVDELRPLVPERIHDAFGPYLDGPSPEASDPDPSGLPSTEPQRDPSDLPAGPAHSPFDPRPTPPSDPPRVDPFAPKRPTPQPDPARQPAGPPAPLDYPEVPSGDLDPGADVPSRSSRGVLDDPFDTSKDEPDPLAPR